MARPIPAQQSNRPRGTGAGSRSRRPALHLSWRLTALAAIPALCTCAGALAAYWRPQPGATLYMTPVRAIATAVLYYLVLIMGIRTMAWGVRWLAQGWHPAGRCEDAVALIERSAPPLLIAGIAALVPGLWFHLAVGLAALAAAGYLAGRNVQRVLQLSGKQAALYAGELLVLGVTVFIFMLAATVLLWDAGLAPGLAI